MHNLFVYTFYRFKELKNINKIKVTFEKLLKKRKIKGTILIANEGINGSLSGSKEELNDIVKLIKSHLKIRKLDIKINKTYFFPFNRLKVRLKKEIVSLGIGKINVKKNTAKLIHPKDWNKIILNKKIRVLDIRNDFEIEIGKFQRSEKPSTTSFREIPKAITKLDINKNEKIAMYCTGGIRCEKTSAFLKEKGYKNIVQLKGGIISYLDYTHKHGLKSCWKGECFVFDERVSINNKLEKGKYSQCYGCRHPITRRDMLSKFYKKGVFCPKCFHKRSKAQIKKSESRQKQIDLAEAKGLDHVFNKKID